MRGQKNRILLTNRHCMAILVVQDVFQDKIWEVVVLGGVCRAGGMGRGTGSLVVQDLQTQTHLGSRYHQIPIEKPSDGGTTDRNHDRCCTNFFGGVICRGASSSSSHSSPPSE